MHCKGMNTLFIHYRTLTTDPEHGWQAWSVQINIEQSDFFSSPGQRQRQIDSGGAFAYPAFS